jgi:ketosteroid isomerase-like protein
MNQAIKQFLDEYERANAGSDLAAIGKLYADIFMFGGANGVRAVNKEDFLKVLPGMKAHFAAMGLSETQLRSVEASAISAKYLLAKARWKMTVLDSRGDRKQVDAFATYILERTQVGTLSIVFPIDHQDLATVIKNQETA